MMKDAQITIPILDAVLHAPMYAKFFLHIREDTPAGSSLKWLVFEIVFFFSLAQLRGNPQKFEWEEEKEILSLG